MRTRVIELEVKIVVVIIVIAFFSKACGSNVDEKTLKALGPEPEAVSEIDCWSNNLNGAASVALALKKGKITEEKARTLNPYATEFTKKTADAVVNVNMSESEAISATATACSKALDRYEKYQKDKKMLKK